MKKFSQFLEPKKGEASKATGYLRVRSPDEQRFLDAHRLETTPDANGNDDDLFKAKNIKYIKRRQERHGYDAPEDAKVNEAMACSADRRKARLKEKLNGAKTMKEDATSASYREINVREPNGKIAVRKKKDVIKVESILSTDHGVPIVLEFADHTERYLTAKEVALMSATINSLSEAHANEFITVAERNAAGFDAMLSFAIENKELLGV